MEDNQAYQWLDNNQLGYDIWNNKYRFQNESHNEWLDRVSGGNKQMRQLIEEKKFLFGGRILANRGLKGRGSLSNCYSRGYVDDSIDSIFDANKDLAKTFKAEGGQGVSLSKIRPEGCTIKNNHASDGIIPFMKVFDTTVGSISQGNSRRGALLMSLDIWHKEASNFIKIKSDLKLINNANLSLEIDDEFMQMVSDYYSNPKQPKPIKHIKRDYSGNIVEYDVDVIELYKELCKHACEFAEPGVLFVGPYREYIMQQYHPEYKIETGNACVTGETLILTKEGYKPIIECVDKSTTVWNGFEWSEVIPKITGENKKIYKITFSDGSTLHCTDNHKFRLSDGADVMTKDLNLSNTYKLQKCEFPIIIGEKSIEEKVAYTQGFFTGDGWISSSNMPIISLFDKKKELLQYFTYNSVWENENYPEIRLNLNPTLNFNKNFVPDTEYSIQTRLDWLAGYLDSDGTVHKAKHGGVSISSIDKERLNKIKLMLNTLGINPSISLMREAGISKLPKNNGAGEYGEYNTKKCYRLLINKYDYFKLIKLGLKTHRIDISNEKMPNRSARRFITINSIEETNRVETVYCFNEPINHTAIFNGVYTCQCSEQSLPKHGACNLCSFNLFEYVKNPFTENSEFDYEMFKKDIPLVVRAMDDIIDENMENHPLKEQAEISRLYRNIGIGFMGLADALIAMGITYGSEEAIKFVGEISKFLFRQSVIASVNLGVERGHFPKYNPVVWDSEIVKNSFNDEEIAWLKRTNRLRNAEILSIAPTGSIGTMLNVSTGIEPNFMLKFERRTVSLNNEETIYKVEASIVEKYRNITGDKGELPEYFVTSHNINWIDRIKMQASSQRYVDTAISSTCNLPKGIKPNEVELIYLEAWKHKLKGFTIYVDGCRDSVLFNENSLSIKDVISNYNNAIKRPKTLKAKYFPVKIKGENFAVIMGFIGDEDRPYEIFAIRPDKHYPAHEGKITKVKKLVYKFESNIVTINDITDTNIDTLEKVITLLLSITLRHQIAIKYITHALDKPVDDITSFVSGISRILKQFQDVEELKDKCPECGGKLVNECGCIHCTECGYSKCGD